MSAKLLATLSLLVSATLMGCDPSAQVTEGREEVGSESDAAQQGTVQAAADNSCSTTSVLGLSKQIVAEVNCIAPNTYAAVPARANLVAASNVLLFMEKPARDALVSALDARPNTTMTVNSMLRTPAQQFLLADWGETGSCGVELAAPPGTSNHEGGLAIDIDQYITWRNTLETRGFQWFGPADDVHYDFVGAGATDKRALGVTAFQRLWNRNNPNDPIAEDGDFGQATAIRMAKSPAAGFALGASCTATSTTPIEVYWSRQQSGSYELRALAGSTVKRVDYLVDGFLIGSASKLDGNNFPDNYTFGTQGKSRKFEVLGFNDNNALVGRGIGMIDVDPGVAFYIRQMGPSLYEVGLERAPAAVAAVELVVDGVKVTDSVSGKVRSTRIAVRHVYSQLGQRQFALSTFNADGTLRGTITRSFKLE